MTEQRTFRAGSSEIRDVFGRWLSAEWAAGVGLVVLEGLMMSGKSYLLKQPFKLGSQVSVNIELDRFLRRPVDPNLEYMDAIDVSAARASLGAARKSHVIVVIWELVRSPVPRN